MSFNISDLDVFDTYEAEKAREGVDIYKVEENRRERTKSLLAVIYEAHEADELADSRMREEARESVQVEKNNTLTSVWEAVEADENQEYQQNF